jgi:thioredoxin 1
MSRVIEIRDHDHYDKLLVENRKLIIFFGAAWCGHCKRIKPVFDKFSVDYKDIIFAHLEVTKVKVENADSHGFPIFVCYTSGDPKGSDYVLEGAYEDKLKSMINNFSRSK